MVIDVVWLLQILGYALGLVVLYFIIRGAVLSALRAHTRETTAEPAPAPTTD